MLVVIVRRQNILKFSTVTLEACVFDQQMTLMPVFPCGELCFKGIISVDWKKYLFVSSLKQSRCIFLLGTHIQTINAFNFHYMNTKPQHCDELMFKFISAYFYCSEIFEGKNESKTHILVYAEYKNRRTAFLRCLSLVPPRVWPEPERWNTRETHSTLPINTAWRKTAASEIQVIRQHSSCTGE